MHITVTLFVTLINRDKLTLFVTLINRDKLFSYILCHCLEQRQIVLPHNKSNNNPPYYFFVPDIIKAAIIKITI